MPRADELAVALDADLDVGAARATVTTRRSIASPSSARVGARTRDDADVGQRLLLERHDVDRHVGGDRGRGRGERVAARLHAVGDEDDARRGVGRHLGERAADRGREIRPVATELDALRRREIALRARRILGRGLGGEGDGADAIVVVHAVLGEAKLRGDARVGARDEIDRARAVDHHDDGQAIERPPELRLAHGERRREARERREEHDERAPPA